MTPVDSKSRKRNGDGGGGEERKLNPVFTHKARTSDGNRMYTTHLRFLRR